LITPVSILKELKKMEKVSERLKAGERKGGKRTETQTVS
jgi:hypothetical protein